MSLSPNLLSPAEDLISERTVGELVAERPARARVFEQFQIDFCCQGGRTLREACDRNGAILESVLEHLDTEVAEETAPIANPAALPPAKLVVHIVEIHHGFLRSNLPRLHGMAQRVAEHHGVDTPSLVEVLDVFTDLFHELASHMLKEEQILFPAITAMAEGRSESMPLDGPIACMMHEHDEAGAALAKLRELTNDYTSPEGACVTYHGLFSGLAELEADLHRHIHLENHVLFPAAVELAAGTQLPTS